ncbi:MAG: hypothetical protein ACFFD4_26480 [Candidatus Odinarchaeota archaeon]
MTRCNLYENDGVIISLESSFGMGTLVFSSITVPSASLLLVVILAGPPMVSSSPLDRGLLFALIIMGGIAAIGTLFGTGFVITSLYDSIQAYMKFKKTGKVILRITVRMTEESLHAVQPHSFTLNSRRFEFQSSSDHVLRENYREYANIESRLLSVGLNTPITLSFGGRTITFALNNTSKQFNMLVSPPTRLILHFDTTKF